MLMLMLWSASRSRSTAFYRMMIERGDFTGVHEPLRRSAGLPGVTPWSWMPATWWTGPLTPSKRTAHVGIDFRPHALSWQPSDRPEWQPFGRWFVDVAASCPSTRSSISGA